MPNEVKMHNVEIGTILSQRTKEGKINIFKDNEQIFQFSIKEASRIHKMLGEAIEAAVSDQIIYQFMREKVGVDDIKASMMLLEFRELRQGTRGTLYQGDDTEGH
jgi:hypothetical protein